VNSFPKSGLISVGHAFRLRESWGFDAASFVTRVGDRQSRQANPCVAKSHSIPSALAVAIIDGPYDAAALSGILSQAPVNLGHANCAIAPSSACNHGTFVMGLLGARRDALIPGLCPDCRLLHVPLFVDENAPSASVVELASAIGAAVAAGARLINLSLAILEEDSQSDPRLAAALDHAEASGAVVLVAAGNQGRLAMGQLLSHPATIPVVAVDRAYRPLRDSNFGPLISRRGVSASGYQVLGYAPGGGTTVMSGTSVATAVATGNLAQLWSERSYADCDDIRAAVVRLGLREGSIPPILDRETLSASLDHKNKATIVAPLPAKVAGANCVSLQGEMSMKDGNGQPILAPRGVGGDATSGAVVTPANGPGGCACRAPGGVCTCGSGASSPGRFIYVLGTVDIKFPDQAISEELEAVARSTPNFAVQGPYESLRHYCWRVLNLKTPDGRILARHVARQVCWVLKVEKQDAYYLSLRDFDDFTDLISCLKRPESGDYRVGDDGNAPPHRQNRRSGDGGGSPPPQYPRQEDLDLFVGSSSLVPVETCPGVAAPVLAVERLSSITKDALLDSFRHAIAGGPRVQNASALFDELFETLVRSADNFGEEDRWRALNYLAVQYMPIYRKYAQLASDHDLVSVDVVPSRLSRERRLLDPVFAFRHKTTGVVQKFYVRMDLSHLFPMVANPLAEYIDR
jgi:Subtilase family/PatG C-terminal